MFCSGGLVLISYEAWAERGQVRLELGEHSKLKVKDVYIYM